MKRCEEDGCPNTHSARRPETGLCDACISLMEADEIRDRQQDTFEGNRERCSGFSQKTFEHELMKGLRTRDYSGLFDLVRVKTELH
jgi:hypothetical protein